MAFKDRLRDMRVQAGITQKGLASAVGITEQSIQNYELGTRKPNNMEVYRRLQMPCTPPQNICSAVKKLL